MNGGSLPTFLCQEAVYLVNIIIYASINLFKIIVPPRNGPGYQDHKISENWFTDFPGKNYGRFSAHLLVMVLGQVSKTAQNSCIKSAPVSRTCITPFSPFPSEKRMPIFYRQLLITSQINVLFMTSSFLFIFLIFRRSRKIITFHVTFSDVKNLL